MSAISKSRFHVAGVNFPAGGNVPEVSAAEIVVRRGPTARRPDDAPVEILSPRVRQLHDYWKTRRGGRLMPSRRDIEPFEIAAILPYVSITELHSNPLRVRFRLAGSVIDELHGRAVTGKWLDDMEVLGGHEFWRQQYARLISEAAPIFGRTVGTYDGAVAMTCDWVLLPLSSEGMDVDRCLELEDWDTRREQDPDEASATKWQITVY